MQLNNGKDTRPVIATFELMAKLGARFTAGDIAIDQSAANPKIYFCTVEEGLDVPIGILANSSVLSTYFTPYMIDPIQIANGFKPYYTALNIGEAEAFIKNPELDASKYEDKLVTLPVLAAFISKYIEGVTANGSYQIVDESNYKDAFGDLLNKSKTYIIGTWRLPQNDTNERSEFLPDDVEVTSNDTALLKVYVNSDFQATYTLREFILYRKYSSTNYVVRYLRVGSDPWVNITAADTYTYVAKVKSLYDRLQKSYAALRHKYDQINQIYKHEFDFSEGVQEVESISATEAIQIYSGSLVINLTQLQKDILKCGQTDQNLQLTESDVDNVTVRFNIVTEGILDPDEGSGKICDSLFVDFKTLLGGVHWLRGGNSYYRIYDGGTFKYLSIPIINLKSGATTLTAEEIKERLMVYVVNIQLKKD